MTKEEKLEKFNILLDNYVLYHLNLNFKESRMEILKKDNSQNSFMEYTYLKGEITQLEENCEKTKKELQDLLL